MSLFIIGTKADGEAFTCRGPFEENDPDLIYSEIEAMEKLYNLNTIMEIYEPVQLHVVRIAHTMRYRDK